jgi:hypothetical protein
MITPEQFERGLRLDQYIATLNQNKENFRANFIKAVEVFSADDLAFFRNLPRKAHIVAITDDGNLDALRDVPVLGRLSVEVGKLVLRLFRVTSNMEMAHIVADAIGLTTRNSATGDIVLSRLPIVAFCTPEMQVIGCHVHRLPELADEMEQRHQAWIAAHPEIQDAREPLEKMSPITRTRLLQALFTMTPEQRILWGRRAVRAWRHMLEGMK